MLLLEGGGISIAKGLKRQIRKVVQVSGVYQPHMYEYLRLNDSLSFHFHDYFAFTLSIKNYLNFIRIHLTSLYLKGHYVVKFKLIHVI